MIEPRERANGNGAPRAVVIEDDGALCQLLGELLADAGWHSRTFTRIGPAHEALRREPPDLIVLDDELPDGSGVDLAVSLRAEPATAGIPILFCTASSYDRLREIRRIGPVLAKPFEIEAFQETVAQVTADR